jgi:hypothetical protein
VPADGLDHSLAAGPAIDSFGVGLNSVAAGSVLTLSAGDRTDLDAGAPVGRVAYHPDSDGDGICDPSGMWALTPSIAGRAPGAYTLKTRARDGSGYEGDPIVDALQLVRPASSTPV